MRSDAVDVVLVVPSGPPAPSVPSVPGESTGTSTPPPGLSSRLPRTGAELFALLLIAVVLLALGALLVRTSRARRACPST